MWRYDWLCFYRGNSCLSLHSGKRDDDCTTQLAAMTAATTHTTHSCFWVRDHWTCYLNKQKTYYIDTCDTNISIRLRFAWALISFSLPLSFYLINVINSRCCGRWTMPMSAFWQLQIPIDLVVPSLVLAAWLQRCRFYFNATCQRSVYTRDAHCTPNEWVYRYD